MDNETLSVRLIEAEKAIEELTEHVKIINLNTINMAKALNQIIAALNNASVELVPDEDDIDLGDTGAYL